MYDRLMVETLMYDQISKIVQLQSKSYPIGIICLLLWKMLKSFCENIYKTNGGNVQYIYDRSSKPFRCNLNFYYLGPVVQSVVSLTSSLRVISLTVLADSIYNILIFFAEKMWVAFALQKLLTFFQQKISAYLRITRCKF